MKTALRLAGILAAVSIAICSVIVSSCNGSEDPEPEKIVTTYIDVPSAIEADAGGAELSLTLRGKTGIHASDDHVLLRSAAGSSYECRITQVVDGSYLNFSIDETVPSGTYNVYIVHGGVNYLCGSTVLTIVKRTVVEPADGATIYGQITCDGEPVAGVAVSDGALVVLTNDEGIYQIKSSKPQPYVFFSVPSGYVAPLTGILPKIYTKLNKAANVPERVDFQVVPAGDQTKHRMLIFGDMHLANRTNDRNQFAKFVDDVNEWTSTHTDAITYGLTLGDMTWDLYWMDNGYTFKEYLIDANNIKDLPIYHTIGNHDHSMYATGDFETVKEYKEYLAPTYYSFNVGNVHYVVLDDILCTNSTPDGNDKKGNLKYVREYETEIPQDQLDWLARDLSFVPKSTPLVVTMHAPLYTNLGISRLANPLGLINILKEYPEVHLFTAHTHKVYNIDNRKSNHIYEHNAGAVCATWWWSAYETAGVHISQDGAPGGYTVLDVDGTSFKWQYKATGRATDFQFRSYDRNTIAITNAKYIPSANETNASSFAPGFWATSSTANEVYLNLWNYDPSWKIEVTENGKSLSVSRLNTKDAKDPLHLVSYTAKRLNKNSKATFATDNTYHLFKVTASSATSTLEIKVTDPFGNVYTETMTRPKTFTTDIYKF